MNRASPVLACSGTRRFDLLPTKLWDRLVVFGGCSRQKKKCSGAACRSGQHMRQNKRVASRRCEAYLYSRPERASQKRCNRQKQSLERPNPHPTNPRDSFTGGDRGVGAENLKTVCRQLLRQSKQIMESRGSGTHFDSQGQKKAFKHQITNNGIRFDSRFGIGSRLATVSRQLAHGRPRNDS